MNMTFDEYISNPMGKKNAVFSNREMFKTMYKQKLDIILVREVGKINYKLYQSKKGNYYIHFKIPSEPIKNFYYDTVIEFYTDQHSAELSRTLKNYYVRFYSNDPSFVFTFAHAMKSNDMLIKDLEKKMSKQALKSVAKEKNPKDEVGYVKSIFFAYLLANQYGLFDKVTYKSYAQNYNPKILLNEVTHADEKVAARIRAGEELNKEKSIQRKKEKIEKKNGPQIEEDPSSLEVPKIAKVANTKKVNKTNSVKKVSKSKKVKKI